MSHHESKLRADPVFYAARQARILALQADVQAEQARRRKARARFLGKRRPCAACGRMFATFKGQRYCWGCRPHGGKGVT